MRVVDVVLAFPFYVLIIALVFFVGEGTHGIYIAFALTDWVVYTRTTRSAALVAVSQDWVAAAEGGGLSRSRVLLRHVLPNTISQAIVYVMSDIVLVILAVVTLGYLGLGIQPPAPDWGAMISDGQSFITVHPWLSIIPGIAVILVGVGLSLLGDGLADLQRPR
jgi:peptide/nickel transport system permease protein